MRKMCSHSLSLALWPCGSLAGAERSSAYESGGRRNMSSKMKAAARSSPALLPPLLASPLLFSPLLPLLICKAANANSAFGWTDLRAKLSRSVGSAAAPRSHNAALPPLLQKWTSLTSHLRGRSAPEGGRGSPFPRNPQIHSRCPAAVLWPPSFLQVILRFRTSAHPSVRPF